jgi:hypothetical protein
MADISVLASIFKVEVYTNYPNAANCVQVKGISDLTPKVDRTLQDADDYDSGGWGGQEVTMQRWSLEMTVLRRADEVSGAYDPGQEYLRLRHDQFGADARAHVRWYDRGGGPEAYSGTGIVTWERANSGVADLDAAKVTLAAAAGASERETIANPAA